MAYSLFPSSGFIQSAPGRTVPFTANYSSSLTLVFVFFNSNSGASGVAATHEIDGALTAVHPLQSGSGQYILFKGNDLSSGDIDVTWSGGGLYTHVIVVDIEDGVDVTNDDIDTGSAGAVSVLSSGSAAFHVGYVGQRFAANAPVADGGDTEIHNAFLDAQIGASVILEAWSSGDSADWTLTGGSVYTAGSYLVTTTQADAPTELTTNVVLDSVDVYDPNVVYIDSVVITAALDSTRTYDVNVAVSEVTITTALDGANVEGDALVSVTGNVAPGNTVTVDYTGFASGAPDDGTVDGAPFDMVVDNGNGTVDVTFNDLMSLTSDAGTLVSNFGNVTLYLTNGTESADTTVNMQDETDHTSVDLAALNTTDEEYLYYMMVNYTSSPLTPANGDEVYYESGGTTTISASGEINTSETQFKLIYIDRTGTNGAADLAYPFLWTPGLDPAPATVSVSADATVVYDPETPVTDVEVSVSADATVVYDPETPVTDIEVSMLLDSATVYDPILVFGDLQVSVGADSVRTYDALFEVDSVAVSPSVDTSRVYDPVLTIGSVEVTAAVDSARTYDPSTDVNGIDVSVLYDTVRTYDPTTGVAGISVSSSVESASTSPSVVIDAVQVSVVLGSLPTESLIRVTDVILSVTLSGADAPAAVPLIDIDTDRIILLG